MLNAHATPSTPAPPVPSDPQEWPAPTVSPDLKENTENKENLDLLPSDHQGTSLDSAVSALPDHRDCPDPLDPSEKQETRARPVPLDSPETLVVRVTRVLLDLSATTATQASKETPERPADPETPEARETRDPKDRQETVDPRDPLVFPAAMETVARTATRDLPDPRDPPDHRDSPEEMESEPFRELPARMPSIALALVALRITWRHKFP